MAQAGDWHDGDDRGDLPRLSLVMPCYNEEAIVGQTVRRVLQAFERAEIPLELVAVDNGSRDATGEILLELAAKYPGIVVHRVDVNVGYGNGVLSGLPLCRAPWVGIIPADGQVDAEDTVRLFEDAVATGEVVLAKARRRFRMDGLQRKVVSIGYNAFFRLFFPGIASLDINGLPKIMPRAVVERLSLTSRQWLLDPEIMVRAHLLGVRVLEYNVFARMRGSGVSHVKATTCLEFVRGVIGFRFSADLRRWRTAVRAMPPIVVPERPRSRVPR
jgi:glycosyltransferase involved in cell wall biosynthesis